MNITDWMSNVEKSLDRIATALEAQQGSTGTESTSTPKEEKERKKPGPKGKKDKTPEPDADAGEAEGGDAVTLEKLREVGLRIIKAGKSKELQKIVSAHDAPNLTNLDAKHYEAVFEQLTALEGAL